MGGSLTMFKALKEDNKIVKIIGYGVMNIVNKTPKEQKEYYKKIEKLYEIPKSKNEREKLMLRRSING
ncbi:pheromone shutdown protein TraB [Clostridium saccharoperbutylacetonicum]|uniref:Uncharacterized protein n=1 Tax=Clostridium saccharoperbutylacetonicum N1-4(HMT) TaxID=931276 RepID=M1MVR7_9CLOT|nr:Gp15 family bacteriophage protein [Clostridium saccharoperbutylacetonicum]AGF55607.1 hypothetical protein Cspa_c18370 [Clostridium saccharoperbutylacetonicum N1-4(HMT)]NSB27035.1 pheromone shutdown protein TraB [Clostridium saccharoperbutylacetonicum]NSB40519.1 pheromone shutdown protein TraB [Clostridium saccharoperbutylacetonicum]